MARLIEEKIHPLSHWMTIIFMCAVICCVIFIGYAPVSEEAIDNAKALCYWWFAAGTFCVGYNRGRIHQWKKDHTGLW